METLHPIQTLILTQAEAAIGLGEFDARARDAIERELASAARGGTLSDALRTLVLIGAYLEQRGYESLAHELYALGDITARLYLVGRGAAAPEDDEARSRARSYDRFTDSPSDARRAPALGELAPDDTTKAGALPVVRRMR